MRFWEFKELASNHREKVVEPGVHQTIALRGGQCASVWLCDAFLKFLVILNKGLHLFI